MKKKKPRRNEFVIGILKKRIYPTNCIHDHQAEDANKLLFFMNEVEFVNQMRLLNNDFI